MAYSDLQLDVFDRNGKKVPILSKSDADSPLTSASLRGKPGTWTSYAIYALGEEVPARAKVRIRNEVFEIAFDPSKLPTK